MLPRVVSASVVQPQPQTFYLRLWGELLRSIPDSSLVLKANAASDPHTQTLLVRRMRRCGLDPERVIWLPLAPSHREHLQQPPGGCRPIASPTVVAPACEAFGWVCL